MGRQIPWNLRCEECGAILRELAEAWRSDWKNLNSSGRDPVELRNELLSCDDSQLAEMYQQHYAKSVEARRKKTEHEVLTGHTVMLHGMWTSGLGYRRV